MMSVSERGKSWAKSWATAAGGSERKWLASACSARMPGGTGYPCDISANDWFAFGAPAATNTSPATFGSVPASEITAPPHEWPTSMTGPSAASIARFVAATSSASDVNGFCTAVTWRPRAWSNGITFAQLEPSAKAPCTRTTLSTPDGAAPAGLQNMRRLSRATEKRNTVLTPYFENAIERDRNPERQTCD